MSVFDRINKVMNSTYKFFIGEEDQEKEDCADKLNISVQQKLKEVEAFNDVYEKTSALAHQAELEWEASVNKVNEMKKQAREALSAGDEVGALEITKAIVDEKEKVVRAENWLATIRMNSNRAKEDLQEKQRELDKFLDGVKYLQRIEKISEVIEKKHEILDTNKYNKDDGANILFNEASSEILARSQKVKGADKLVVSDAERLEKDLRDSKRDREALDLLEELKKDASKAIEDKKKKK